MKTVYTVTFHQANNYGAMLQTYALQRVLSKRYLTKILNYNNPIISDNWKLFQKEKNSNFKKQTINFAKNAYNLRQNICRRHNFRNFNKQLSLTESYDKNTLVLERKYPKADAYVAGSDQIWNPEITQGIDDIYTLSFGNDDFKKISYAASTGNNQTLLHHADNLVNRLKGFNSISVREQPLLKFLSNKGVSPIALTIDPTLLLDKMSWEAFAGLKQIEKRPYVFVYAGDASALLYKIVNQIAKTKHLLIVYFDRHDIKKNFQYKKKSYYTKGPNDFVNLIQNASYVVTNSFHGTALASVLNRPFLSVPQRYSDRLTTLLTTINLSDRIIYNMQDFNRAIQQDIDWQTVNKRIEQKRIQSLQWLYNAIDRN